MEEKIITTNRYASHEYFILDRIEAGIVLEGSEVKSIRQNSVNLKDSFCVVYGGEMYIKNMHIAVWQNDKELYKANRVEARAAQAEFEDYAYTFQDNLIAEK